MGKPKLKPNQPNPEPGPTAAAEAAAAPKPEPFVTHQSWSNSGGNMDDYADIMSGYRQFAETGGFSPQDLANIRSRSIAPIRSVYDSAKRDVNRQRSLQGGYAPNYAPAMARLAREQSMSQSEATTNAEAGLSQMVAQNRLSGLGGMLSTFSAYPSSSGSTSWAPPDEEEEALMAPPEKKKGFWGKLGSGLAKVGRVALPFALSPIPGGSILGGALSKLGKKPYNGPIYGPGY